MVMAEKTKIPDRDKTLVNILERIADQLQKQESLLEEIFQNQSEAQKAANLSESRYGAFQGYTDNSLEKIGQSISRYRSDMLSLVNEQDSINNNLKELNKLINKTAYALESADQKLADFDGRLKFLEKASNAHYENSQRQAESIPREIAETSRGIAKLHADTDKHMDDNHHDLLKQLEKLQQDISRRLLILDSFDSALQTLLIRTEPPEKKQLWIVRLFNKATHFFRYKLPVILKINKKPKG